MLTFHLFRSLLMSLKFSGFLHIFLKMFQVYTFFFFFCFSQMGVFLLLFVFPFQMLIFLNRFCLSQGSYGSNLQRYTLRQKKGGGWNSLEAGQGLLCSLRAEGGVGLRRGPGNKNCLVSLCCFSVDVFLSICSF